MHFTFSVHMREWGVGLLRPVSWSHGCIIPGYWLWDSPQSGWIPSHLSRVQRLNLMHANTAGHIFCTLKVINYTCLRRQGEVCLLKVQRAWLVSLRGAALDPFSAVNAWIWALQKIQMAGPGGVVPIWQGFKVSNASLTLSLLQQQRERISSSDPL